MNSPKPPFDLVIGMDRSDRKVDLHLLDLPAHTEQSATLSTDRPPSRPGSATSGNVSRADIASPSSSNNWPTTSSVS